MRSVRFLLILFCVFQLGIGTKLCAMKMVDKKDPFYWAEAITYYVGSLNPSRATATISVPLTSFKQKTSFYKLIGFCQPFSNETKTPEPVSYLQLLPVEIRHEFLKQWVIPLYQKDREKLHARMKSFIAGDQHQILKQLLPWCDSIKPFYNLISTALEWRCDECLRLLLANGASLDFYYTKTGTTPLIYAADLNFRAGIEIILKHGQDPNKKNNEGMTALLMAARNQNYTNVVLLHNYGGARVTECDNEGRSALHYALAKWPNSYTADNIMLLVRFLLKRNVPVNKTDKAGRTPLHYCAHSGIEECIKLLLDKKAHINQQDNDDNTPLLLAALRQNTNIVKELMVRGADANIRNNKGQTVVDIILNY